MKGIVRALTRAPGEASCGHTAKYGDVTEVRSGLREGTHCVMKLRLLVCSGLCQGIECGKMASCTTHVGQ